MSQSVTMTVEEIQNEMIRFNAACASGRRPVIETPIGHFEVAFVDPDFTLHCYPVGRKRGTLNLRKIQGANNETWAYLLKITDVIRA